MQSCGPYGHETSVPCRYPFITVGTKGVEEALPSELRNQFVSPCLTKRPRLSDHIPQNTSPDNLGFGFDNTELCQLHLKSETSLEMEDSGMHAER